MPETAQQSKQAELRKEASKRDATRLFVSKPEAHTVGNAAEVSLSRMLEVKLELGCPWMRQQSVQLLVWPE